MKEKATKKPTTKKPTTTKKETIKTKAEKGIVESLLVDRIEPLETDVKALSDELTTAINDFSEAHINVVSEIEHIKDSFTSYIRWILGVNVALAIAFIISLIVK